MKPYKFIASLYLICSLSLTSSVAGAFENKFLVIHPPKGGAWKLASTDDYKVALISSNDKDKFSTIYASVFMRPTQSTDLDFQKEAKENFSKYLLFKEGGFSIKTKNISEIEKGKYICIFGHVTGENPQHFKLLTKVAVCKHPAYRNLAFMVGYSVTELNEMSEDLSGFKSFVYSINFKK